MANFTFTVETDEMATAIHEVAPHVDGATAAVVTMQAAVIAAEKRAADHICENVNRGFFGLIRSQISQKVAIVRSQVEARLLELRDQSLKLMSVKNSMERDFQMISSRYTKLFKSLDSALFSRIHEVDQRTLDLTRRDLRRIERRCESFQASLPMHQLESVGSAQLIAASGTKANAALAITAMSKFIAGSTKQNLLSTSILNPGQDNQPGIRYLPVMIVEADSSATGAKQWRHHLPKMPSPALDQQVSQAVERGILGTVENLSWRPADRTDAARVAQGFSRLIEQSSIDDRVRSQMTKMFAAAKWSQVSRVTA